ncbi:DUF4136 domain-containing protein [Moritella sp. F3]|uniref:DUF4136 domain-containing protein n=1 Tax=Moritella sp. F3 TaxID=2718882 RepID=UPI0018E0F9B6|nr:DUF4136 domain-containing protein [Moritella sp. F3]GIC78230.1 hypothetical protein FMO001_29570 [Moritella sp. F1]GIC81126.1 hypothetical protein FMO003_14070 [Moritella sp. F3]
MIKNIMPLLAMAILLVGCTTSEYPPTNGYNSVNQLTKVETGDLAQFAQQKMTFAWYPGRGKTFLPENSNKALFSNYTETAITQIMQDKGYTFTNNVQQADFLIGYGLAVESELSDEQIFNKVGSNLGLSMSHLDPDEFQKGSAIIAFYNPQTFQTEWQVLAQGIAKIEQSQQARKDKITAVMLSMLNHVPAK